ncbi:MAG: BACON domain-containing protein [Candidatus Cryptobacteroides sp.]
MKKYLTLAAAALAVLVSCNKEEDTTDPVESSISLDPATLTIPAGGDVKTVTVTSSEDWNIRDYKESDWCKVSPVAGKSGDKVTIEVSTPTYEAREVKFVFVSGTAEATLTVSQDVTNRTISIEPNSLHFTEESGSNEITVTCSDNWTVKNYESDKWYSLSAQSGSNGDKVTVSVTAADYDVRAVSLVFVCGKAEAELTITQDTKEQSISINPTELEFTADGGVRTVAVESTSAWTAEEDLDWAWVEADSEGNALVNVLPSDTPSVQTGVIVFRCADKTASLAITQEACSVVEFADKNFEAIVLAIEGADRNGDGLITPSEAAAVEYIDCRNKGDISTIEDIKNFPALREFFITDNIITSVDFTANKNLEIVVCQNNPKLVSADFTGLDRLQLLDIQGCGNLESLSVKGCTSLRELGVNNLCKLTSLDVTDCTELRNLYFQNNENLVSFDLTKCVNLEVLQMNYAPKFEGDLDLSKNTALREMTIGDFWHSNIILGTMPNLERATLTINNSKVESFDFSGSPALKYLEIVRNYGLKSLNLDGCTELQGLVCFDTAITELDLSTNNALNDFRPGSPDQEPRYLNLTKLTLSKANSLPESKIEEIKTYCPDIEIVYVD